MTGHEINRIADAVAERLDPRFRAMETRFDRVERAVLHLASTGAGTLESHESHTARETRAILAASD